MMCSVQGICPNQAPGGPPAFPGRGLHRYANLARLQDQVEGFGLWGFGGFSTLFAGCGPKFRGCAHRVQAPVVSEGCRISHISRPCKSARHSRVSSFFCIMRTPLLYYPYMTPYRCPNPPAKLQPTAAVQLACYLLWTFTIGAVM